ncbi:MAG: hydantoinase/oxoprolinase family protein [Bacillota bacterium]|nr:MAG: hydantoinase/oxoprolinase family protein [Bacillota bacterium]
MRLAVDIGGTFTDLLLVDDDSGEIWIEKVLTTYPDPSEGFLNAVQKASAASKRPLSGVDVLVHGTTLGINAIIERKGSPTALLATEGFSDSVELRREQRYVMYDLLLELPEPLAPRNLRFGIRERVTSQGEVLVPLDTEQVAKLLSRLTARGIEAVAVCFLHSYRNPAHETAVAEIAREVAPGLNVSLSSRVNPEVKEYERASTTLCNAYLQGRMAEYIENIEASLAARGFAGAFFIMQSSGGLTSSVTAKELPVRVLESGPVGGMLCAAHHGRVASAPKLLAFDMGGTTAKIGVIDGGSPLVAPGFEVDRRYRFAKGSGLPVRAPVIELLEIGAGGGSIAQLDALGLVKVGPESAGSSPGPACYNLGGTRPTVTDADLMLGYLNPAFFLGGEMTLSPEAAEQAILNDLAGPLGMDPREAAWGIHELVNESMASAARVHLTDRGKDPGDYPLFAYGGAGPVHAFGVARVLGSPQVIIPLGAGVASARGFLTAPASFEAVQGWYRTISETTTDEIGDLLRHLEDQGRAMLATAGIPDDRIEVHGYCAMRYEGQGHDVRVHLPGARVESKAALSEAFERRYASLYGRTVAGRDIKLVTWGVIAQGPSSDLRLSQLLKSADSGDGALTGQRPVFWPESRSCEETPVYSRYALRIGESLEGPAIIEERESTIVVGHRARARVDGFGNVVIDLE